MIALVAFQNIVSEQLYDISVLMELLSMMGFRRLRLITQ